jgi:hypothetical protein
LSLLIAVFNKQSGVLMNRRLLAHVVDGYRVYPFVKSIGPVRRGRRHPPRPRRAGVGARRANKNIRSSRRRRRHQAPLDQPEIRLRSAAKAKELLPAGRPPPEGAGAAPLLPSKMSRIFFWLPKITMVKLKLVDLVVGAGSYMLRQPLRLLLIGMRDGQAGSSACGHEGRRGNAANAITVLTPKSRAYAKSSPRSRRPRMLIA